MSTIVGSLLVALGLDSAEFRSGLTDAEKQLRKTTKNFEKIGSNISNLGRNMTLALTAPLVAFGVASFKAAAESKDAMAQVEASLASMGRQAEFTTEQLASFASDEMKNSLFDDDEILRKVTATLLTFGTVAGEEFKRAQSAAVDLSAKLGTDLQAATMLVGKSLNDPVKGLAALARSGIQFTAAQKETIKTMVEVGNQAGAQKMILAELEKQFAGSAEAVRKANPAAAMKQAFAELQENVGAILMPTIERITAMLQGLADKFNSLSPATQNMIVGFLAIAAVAGPVLLVVGQLVTLMTPLAAAIRVAGIAAAGAAVPVGGLTVGLTGLRAAIIAVTLAAGPWLAAFALVSAAIYLFTRSTEAATAAAEKKAKALDVQAKSADYAAQMSAKLMRMTEAERQATINAMKAARAKAAQDILAAKAALKRAQAELALAKAMAYKTASSTITAGVGGSSDELFSQQVARVGSKNDPRVKKLNGAVDKLTGAIDSMELSVAKLDAGIASATAYQVAIPSTESGDTKKTNASKPRKGADGPSAAEIERRFTDELAQFTLQAYSAMQSLAMTAEERAELELRALELSRLRTIESIKADKDYSEAQKLRLVEKVDQLAELEREGIERQKQIELERQATDLREVAFNAERDLLDDQMAMADTQIERKNLALKILALEQQERRQALERIVNNDKLDDAIRARAQAEIDTLAAIEKSETARTSRDSETEAEAFGRSLSQTPEQINEALDGIKIDGLKALNQGLTDAIMGFRSLGDVAKSILQQITAELLQMAIRTAIIKPLAAALGIPMFAKGTNFAPGGLSIVGEEGPELVNLRRGSQVIPNHELGSIGGGSNMSVTMNFPNMTDASQSRETKLQMSNQLRRVLNNR